MNGGIFTEIDFVDGLFAGNETSVVMPVSESAVASESVLVKVGSKVRPVQPEITSGVGSVAEAAVVFQLVNEAETAIDEQTEGLVSSGGFGPSRSLVRSIAHLLQVEGDGTGRWCR